jgi:hypothetical protein
LSSDNDWSQKILWFVAVILAVVFFIVCNIVIHPCILHPPVLCSFESGNSLSSSSSSSLSEPSASIDGQEHWFQRHAAVCGYSMLS